uniref:Uncharacterized protein LOC102807464 n=1 Tax=Saccoglossus kowalevskii TaxID=10224 RepID=A0ABM0LWC8_SACKO|nr:PREDICTED: uncharacterized protein LOC102807464 [Saccoglossus kowalevskii]
MRIHVTVDTVEFSPIPRQSEEQVTASFLSKLLNDRETSAPTRYAVEGIHPGLSVDDVIKIRKDCATFVVSCRTLSAVDTLWERYQDCDRLLKLMQKTLVTDSLLKEVIAKDITIQIQMDEDEYHICREELLAAAAAGLNIPMSYGGPKKEVMEQLRKQSDKYKVQLNETITEYHKFEMNMTNFVSALKRIKPTSVQKLSSVFMVDKYFEICSSKTSNMKRALELFRQNINNMAHLHDNVRDNVLANMSKIRPEVETDLQTKCRLKVEAHLSEWERMLDPHCDIAQIAIHQSAKECTPTPDLLALRPVLSLIPTLLEMAGKVDRRVSTYIQDDDNNNV